MILRMATIGAIVLLSGATLAQDAPEELACESDADCVVLEGVCPGEWGAVNKALESKARGRISRMRPMVECMPPVSTDEVPVAMCKDGQCLVRMVKDPDAYRHPQGILNPLFERLSNKP